MSKSDQKHDKTNGQVHLKRWAKRAERRTARNITRTIISKMEKGAVDPDDTVIKPDLVIMHY